MSRSARGTPHALFLRTPTIALLVCLAQPAAAHVPELRGRVIDLVSQSDLVVVGKVEYVAAIDTRLNDTTVRVEGHFIGETDETVLTFRAQRRFVPGQRFVFFLRRVGTSLECVQPTGTVFPSRPEDDAAYRETVAAIQRALGASVVDRPAALRAAVIPALSAAAPPLRYHAALELAALAHHGLTESERASLERLVADSACDPTIRSIVTSILRTAAEPASPAAPVNTSANGDGNEGPRVGDAP